MRSTLVAAVGVWVACVCALATAGCRGAASGVPVVYPATWPVPQLTAPPGATQALLPTFLVTEKTNPSIAEAQTLGERNDYGGGLYWAVGFNFRGTWEEARQHVESCLKPLGFSVTIRDDEPIQGVLRGVYLSPDRRTHVKFLRVPGFARIGGSTLLVRRTRVYFIQVNVYDIPLDPQRSSHVGEARPIP